MQTRPSTSLQLRRNHFLTLAASVKRCGFAAVAMGAIALPVVACLPGPVGLAVWQVLQLQSLPWVEEKKRRPRSAEKPANAGAPARASASKPF